MSKQSSIAKHYVSAVEPARRPMGFHRPTQSQRKRHRVFHAVAKADCLTCAWMRVYGKL